VSAAPGRFLHEPPFTLGRQLNPGDSQLVYRAGKLLNHITDC
jgi:hypothetical protein